MVVLAWIVCCLCLLYYFYVLAANIWSLLGKGGSAIILAGGVLGAVAIIFAPVGSVKDRAPIALAFFILEPWSLPVLAYTFVLCCIDKYRADH